MPETHITVAKGSNALGRQSAWVETIRRAWWAIDFSDRDAVARVVWLFVALGVAARLVRYALGFPLWSDEYLLAANLLDRDFGALLRPLDNNQVAPVGFLW